MVGGKPYSLRLEIRGHLLTRLLSFRLRDLLNVIE